VLSAPFGPRIANLHLLLQNILPELIRTIGAREQARHANDRNVDVLSLLRISHDHRIETLELRREFRRSNPEGG
jgi:hypothetical protein